MKLSHTDQRARIATGGPSRSGYWSGFSVCMCLVLLALLIWAVHYRMAQYEAMETTGAHVHGAKMLLTDRNQLPVASSKTIDTAALFLIAFAFASIFCVLGCAIEGSAAGWAAQRLPNRVRHPRLSGCLTYYFFLPPPLS